MHSGFLRTLFFFGLTIFVAGQVASQTEKGVASYYSDSFQGRPTASGEKYDRNAFTAAHPRYPFGTTLVVSRIDDGRSVKVRVNDRGPYRKGRVVDLSRAAAAQIGLLQDGITEVEVKVLKMAEKPASKPKPSPPSSSEGPPADLPIVDHLGRPIGSGSVQVQEERTNRPEATNHPAKNQPPTHFQTGLFKFQSTPTNYKGYGVQVGAYFDIYRLIEAVNILNADGYPNTLVHSTLVDQTPVFRLIVGPVSSSGQARHLLDKLARAGYQGIVKDLQGLE